MFLPLPSHWGLCTDPYVCASYQVFTSTILQQVFEVEYIVSHGQCPDCTRLAAKNMWKASVQVRQKVNHKRTFLFLEQLILKHNAHKDTVRPAPLLAHKQLAR